MKNKPKYKIHDLTRVTYFERTFSKGDTTNCTYKLGKIMEIIHDLIPSYRIDHLPE